MAQYAAAGSAQPMRRVEQRSFWLYLLLSIVTLSAYHYWFLYHWARDVNTICDGDGENTPSLGMMLLLSAMSLGVYKYVWFAHIADRLYNNAARYGIEPGADGELLCLCIILLPVLGGPAAMALAIHSTNRVAAAYNAALRRRAAKRPAGNRRQGAAAQPPAPHATALPQQPAPPLAGGTGGLLELQGSHSGTYTPLLPGQQLVLGRDPQRATLVLKGEKISRVHCTILYSGAQRGYLLTDHSRNGVVLNNRPLPKELPVHASAGSLVSLAEGQYVFKLL